MDTRKFCELGKKKEGTCEYPRYVPNALHKTHSAMLATEGSKFASPTSTLKAWMYEELLPQAEIMLDIFLFFSKLVCHLEGGESGSQIPVRQSLYCNQSDTKLSITTTRALPENTLLLA